MTPPDHARPSFRILAFFMLTAAWLLAACWGTRQPQVNIQPPNATSIQPESLFLANQGSATPAPPSWPAQMAGPDDPPPASANLAGPTTKGPHTPTATYFAPASLETSDLLFISANNLMRWDYVTNYTSLLVNQVVDFAVNGGQRVALLRARQISINGVELFDLAVLDFESKQILTLLESIPRPAKFALSPDELWIAYISAKKQVLALRTDALAEPIVLGECQGDSHHTCNELAWSPDSRSLLWSDAQGAWISELGKNTTSLVHPNHVALNDPNGQVIQLAVTFHAFAWSPGSRYILVQVAPDDSEVRWRCILDTRRRRLVEVPGSYDVQPKTNAIWLQDGSLLSVQGSNAPGQASLYLKHWRLVDTRDDLLVLASLHELHPDDFPSALAGSLSALPYCVNWLAAHLQPDNEQIVLGISQPGAGVETVLYALDLKKNSLNKLLKIPAGSTNVLWAPDASGVIVLGSQSQVLYAPLNGAALQDLRPIFGAQAYGFTWLSPTPRT